MEYVPYYTSSNEDLFRLHISWQTGFSQGKPNISNDDELASEVVGFLDQFLEVFDELKGSNFFVTGESVRGFY